jgi:hypothetical protein
MQSFPSLGEANCCRKAEAIVLMDIGHESRLFNYFEGVKLKKG